MSSKVDQFAWFGNGHRDNKVFTMNLGESMTLYFKDAGTDTATTKYYNLKSEAKQVQIVVNKIATITHIDNQELSFPKTLGTATANVFTRGIEWGKITVRADQNATSFEVYAS
jgi:hypothetical protein